MELWATTTGRTEICVCGEGTGGRGVAVKKN